MENTWTKIATKMPLSGIENKVLLLIVADDAHSKGYMEVGYYDEKIQLFKCTWDATAINPTPIAWQGLPSTKLG